MNFAIIAAGEGSRLVNEGIETPKPLVQLDGRPMIRRLIDIFISCDASHISIIINEDMPRVRQYIESLALPIPISVVVKSTPSSMHSFYEVSRSLPEGKFILTTVDTIFHEDDFRRYAATFRQTVGVDAFMAVTDFIDDEKPLYIDVDTKMRITAFKDSPDGSERYISGGIYGLNDKAVSVLRKCISDGMSRMRNYQRALISAGLNVQAYPFGKIIDVDHAADIDTARAFIASAPAR